MGEFIKFRGESWKIGTCEDLYYARYSEFKVNAALYSNAGDGNVSDFLKPDTYRFRFPFPDEDEKFRMGVAYCDPYDRGYLLKVPREYTVEIGHDTFFVRKEDEQKNWAFGFRVPCPYHTEAEKYQVQYFMWETKGYNLFEVVQQKPVIQDGKFELQTVVRCPICGNVCRLSLSEVLELERWANDNAKAFEKQGDTMAAEIIRRMKEGYFINQ